MAIVALDQKTAKFLTTAQVITSVSTAVKELVENAIDAGANSVEIKLEDSGASLIEVSDNGKGIAEVDTPFMAVQSYTSKIKDFCDLDALESYGFRGEALSSLCRVADVTIITKTNEDEAARLYKMNHNGCIESFEHSHRSLGTTIQAKSMFKDLPVRRQIITGGRRASQDVKTLETLLRCFALCHPKIRLNYRVNGNVILTKPSAKTAKENLTYLLGKKFVSQIDIIEKVTPEVDVYLTIPKKDATEFSDVCLCGQHIFINQRPVSYKEIEKAVNQRLVEYFGEKIPPRKKLGFILGLTVLPADVDVNLEPNKTSVLLTKQAKIIETLDKIIVKHYGIETTIEDKPVEKSASGNDSTSEYHDCTSSETKILEIPEVSATKRRKIENKTGRTKATGSSGVKRVAAFEAEEQMPKKVCGIAKKLFETPTKIFNESNKENSFANFKTLKESLEDCPTQVTSETISQLPVVDLGEDFSTQEILDLPNLDPIQVSAFLHNDSNENSGFLTIKEENAPIVTEEAWSKGQVPINLHGGTDVHIYNHAAKDFVPEMETVTDINSTACPGFSKFSREMRSQIIRENPGINYVETAKMLTSRWKELSPEERGYYRDLAAADKAQQRNHDTSIGSSKVSKQRVTNEEAESNKKKFIDMLDKMKNTKSETKKEKLMMRTVVPWTLGLENVAKSFHRNKSNDHKINKNIVLGGLNENVWIVRTGFQLWALSLDQLFHGLSLEKPKENEITREFIEELVEKWLREKEGLSLLHPVFELG